MGNSEQGIIRSTKVVLVPYPAQGHVSPMLKLASAFLSHGLEPVIVTPEFIHRKIDDPQEPNISFVSVPDGFEAEASPSPDFFAIEKAMESGVMSIHLERLLNKYRDGGGVHMVVDLLASWAIEVGGRCGVPVAGFWPAMLDSYRLIAAIPELIRAGLISDTGSPQAMDPTQFLPNQPLLSTEDLPWLIGTPDEREARFTFWIRTLERSKNLPWILSNSFPLESIDEKSNILPIGPLGKQTIHRNPSLWEEDMSCLNWLDNQNPNSVMYISFGSWVSIRDEIVERLAMALEEATNQSFLWVLKSCWQEHLPNGFMEKVSKRGKVVSWAPQLEVLQHTAVGCYLSHCGWNSTMEAIQCQKRLLCYPLAGDQFLNCAYIVKKWRIGVRINGFGKEDIEGGLRRVWQDNEMDNKMKKLYERTMGEEATSLALSNLAIFIDQFKKNASTN